MAGQSFHLHGISRPYRTDEHRRSYRGPVCLQVTNDKTGKVVDIELTTRELLRLMREAANEIDRLFSET